MKLRFFLCQHYRFWMWTWTCWTRNSHLQSPVRSNSKSNWTNLLECWEKVNHMVEDENGWIKVIKNHWTWSLTCCRASSAGRLLFGDECGIGRGSRIFGVSDAFLVNGIGLERSFFPNILHEIHVGGVQGAVGGLYQSTSTKLVININGTL